MRIHSLTMTGIGPYAGREHIDFDAVDASGRFLLTGPTGSGKTTTLYTALSGLNTADVKIITVEDPVELYVEDIQQMQVRPGRKRGPVQG